MFTVENTDSFGWAVPFTMRVDRREIREYV